MDRLVLTVLWLCVGFLFLLLSLFSGSKKWTIFFYYSLISAYFQFYEFNPLYNLLLFFGVSLFTLIITRKEI